MNTNGGQNMTISEAGEISDLIKHLPLEQIAYTEIANVDDLNGWYVVFDTFKAKVYDFNLAISYYTVLADLSRKGSTLCD